MVIYNCFRENYNEKFCRCINFVRTSKNLNVYFTVKKQHPFIDQITQYQLNLTICFPYWKTKTNTHIHNTDCFVSTVSLHLNRPSTTTHTHSLCISLSASFTLYLAKYHFLLLLQHTHEEPIRNGSEISKVGSVVTL